MIYFCQDPTTNFEELSEINHADIDNFHHSTTRHYYLTLTQPKYSEHYYDNTNRQRKTKYIFEFQQSSQFNNKSTFEDRKKSSIIFQLFGVDLSPFDAAFLVFTIEMVLLVVAASVGCVTNDTAMLLFVLIIFTSVCVYTILFIMHTIITLITNFIMTLFFAWINVILFLGVCCGCPTFLWVFGFAWFVGQCVQFNNHDD